MYTRDDTAWCLRRVGLTENFVMLEISGVRV